MARKKTVKRTSSGIGMGFKVYIPKARKVPMPFKPKGSEERKQFKSVKKAERKYGETASMFPFERETARENKVVEEARMRGQTPRDVLFAESAKRTSERFAGAIVTGQSKGFKGGERKFREIRQRYTKGINTRRLQQ